MESPEALANGVPSRRMIWAACNISQNIFGHDRAPVAFKKAQIISDFGLKIYKIVGFGLKSFRLQLSSKTIRQLALDFDEQ